MRLYRARFILVAIQDGRRRSAPSYCERDSGLPHLATRATPPSNEIMVRAMKDTELDDGAVTSVGATWTDVWVFPKLKERVLLLIDRFAHELDFRGELFENLHSTLSPLRRGMRRECGNDETALPCTDNNFLPIRETLERASAQRPSASGVGRTLLSLCSLTKWE